MTTVSITEPHTVEKNQHLFPFTSERCGRKESVVICDLPLCWETEDEPPGLGHDKQWKKESSCLLPLCERGNMCWGDRELPASFLHKLVSHSMGAADCSMAAPGPMLPLCQDLTSLDYHHNIHQLSSTPPPLPPTLPPPAPGSPYPFSTPGPIPPAGSSLNDTLSICLIISPLAAPLWPSPGTTFFSQGGAKGPKALQLDFLTAHLEGHTLCDTINPSLSSSKLKDTGHINITSKILEVCQGEPCFKCRSSLILEGFMRHFQHFCWRVFSSQYIAELVVKATSALGQKMQNYNSTATCAYL